jgi:phosphotransferase system  glucose/maltose/N-acetylglucosamine-specific IIC component
VLSFIWPPIGNGINAFSHWAVNGQPALAFTIYGVVERSLIPFGLHHIWNVPFFFQPATIPIQPPARFFTAKSRASSEGIQPQGT